MNEEAEPYACLRVPHILYSKHSKRLLLGCELRRFRTAVSRQFADKFACLHRFSDAIACMHTDDTACLAPVIAEEKRALAMIAIRKLMMHVHWEPIGAVRFGFLTSCPGEYHR